MMRARRAARRVHNNCSGKHAGILALCKAHRRRSGHVSGSLESRAARRFSRSARALSDDDPARPGRSVSTAAAFPFMPPRLRRRRFPSRVWRRSRTSEPRRREGAARRARRDDRVPRIRLGHGRPRHRLMHAGHGGIACKVGAEGVHAAAWLSRGAGLAVEGRRRRVACPAPRRDRHCCPAGRRRSAPLRQNSRRSRGRSCIIGRVGAVGAIRAALIRASAMSKNSRTIPACPTICACSASGSSSSTAPWARSSWRSSSPPDDFGGARYQRLQRSARPRRAPTSSARSTQHYLEAGADVVETDSFTGSRLKLDEYGLGDRTAEINRARRAARARGVRHSLHAGSSALRRRLDGPDRHARLVVGSVALEDHLRTSCATSTASRRATWSKAARTCCCSRRCKILLELKAAIAGIVREFDRGLAPRSDSSAADADYRRAACCSAPTSARSSRRSTRCRVDVIGLNCSTGPRADARLDSLSVRELALLRERHPQRGTAADGPEGRNDLSRERPTNSQRELAELRARSSA